MLMSTELRRSGRGQT